MGTHHTKSKGDLAVAKTIADLTEKGFAVFTPLAEHLPFDLIAYSNRVCYRIQVKYASHGYVQPKTSWSDKNGRHVKKYEEGDFDYYAIYLPLQKVVCYPSIQGRGVTIRESLPKGSKPFYWYEDFLSLTDTIPEKRTLQDFGVTLTLTRKGSPRPSTRKVTRPAKNELAILLWQKPMKVLAEELGVSDKAVAKWAKNYGLDTPGRGYWAKNGVTGRSRTD